VSFSNAFTSRLPPTRFSLKASIALIMSFIFSFLLRFNSCSHNSLYHQRSRICGNTRIQQDWAGEESSKRGRAPSDAEEDMWNTLCRHAT
jgi:hypothetical protein